jgi:hypothetical protein
MRSRCRGPIERIGTTGEALAGWCVAVMRPI